MSFQCLEDMSANRFVAAAGERFAPLELEEVNLPTGKMLYHAGEQTEHIFFPTTGTMMSLLKTMMDGSRIEVGVCGTEGLTGVHVVTGANAQATDAMVQVGGPMLRTTPARLKRLFDSDATARAILLQYVNFYISQSAQTAACNRLHNIEQRLSKWLLVSRDRLGSDELGLTHEFISHMLGVRRAGVTTSLGDFAAAAIVKLGRNRITVVDAAQLEKLTCECYAVERDAAESMLQSVAAIAGRRDDH